ncbi:ATP-binding cassette transporter [Clonorchis sinensis]|uniref:ATP-binding cassette transporter n=1 Tax=Clonorchis sinensis TaxID=79923 RepID=G7YKR4_CLOSI|nr:ATP-binding cassette transporter [Clonorchis sinensis]
MGKHSMRMVFVRELSECQTQIRQRFNGVQRQQLYFEQLLSLKESLMVYEKCNTRGIEIRDVQFSNRSVYDTVTTMKRPDMKKAHVQRMAHSQGHQRYHTSRTAVPQSDGEKKFYGQLSDLVTSAPPNDFLFLLHDFSARFGMEWVTYSRIGYPAPLVNRFLVYGILVDFSVWNIFDQGHINLLHFGVTLKEAIFDQHRVCNSILHGNEHVDEAWQTVKGAMLAVFSAVCSTSPIRPQDHWMSARSLSMTDTRKSIPAGNEYDGARKSLKRQIEKSLRKDRELWWTSKTREVEKAFAAGNSRVLYQLIRSTGPRKVMQKVVVRQIHMRRQNDLPYDKFMGTSMLFITFPKTVNSATQVLFLHECKATFKLDDYVRLEITDYLSCVSKRASSVLNSSDDYVC